MEDNYQSEWSKSIPLREQKQIIKRLLHFAKPFKRLSSLPSCLLWDCQ